MKTLLVHGDGELLVATLGALFHVRSDMKAFRVQQLLLRRLTTSEETHQRLKWHQISSRLLQPFWPPGHNSGLMLMTPFCPPRDEQAGAAHLPPDGA